MSFSKLLFWLSMILISINCQAFDTSSNQPISIESDSANLNDQTGIAVYTGNVIISQGLSSLRADTISVNAVDRKLVSIKASGGPAHFIQQTDASEAVTHGYGSTIVYIAKENVLKFLGDAKLVQAENSFSGEEIEYDIVRRAIKAKGDEAVGSRVRIQYIPNSQSDEKTENSDSNGDNEAPKPNTDQTKKAQALTEGEAVSPPTSTPVQ